MSIFLDLKKAFDHDILLLKTSALGICGKTNCWFKAYLKNRKQFCYVEGEKSPASKIDYYIRQWSCFGSLLFIIYINDFEHCLQGATPNMCADDPNITFSSSDSASLQRNIDIEIANVAEWMSQNKFSLNANKSEIMVKSHSRHHNSLNELMEIKFNQEIIGKVTKTKDVVLV